MVLEDYFSNDKGIDRAKIANAVRSGTISDGDFEILLTQLKERNYFQDVDFKKNENKDNWNLDYANKLCLNCHLYFSESYLRHLREVSFYVNKNVSTVNYKIFKIIVPVIIILSLILVLFFSKK